MLNSLQHFQQRVKWLIQITWIKCWWSRFPYSRLVNCFRSLSPSCSTEFDFFLIHNFLFLPFSSGYTITTSGYKLLESIQDIQNQSYLLSGVLREGKELSTNLIQSALGDVKLVAGYFDKLKRFHFTTSRRGPLHLFNRANRFHVADIQTHVNDLVEVDKDLFFHFFV